MPTFDIVSELELQEIRNAVDQASREITTRFDFKNTNTTVDLNDKDKKIEITTVSEERCNAARQVLEEKLVKRKVSLKSLEWGKVTDAASSTVRQTAVLQAGISSDKAKAINRAIKELNLKGVSSQTQGEQVRVTGKKRDDLQEVISALREQDHGIPLQFENFRD
jgi:cyclic-di-GMP-binding protein